MKRYSWCKLHYHTDSGAYVCNCIYYSSDDDQFIDRYVFSDLVCIFTLIPFLGTKQQFSSMCLSSVLKRSTRSSNCYKTASRGHNYLIANILEPSSLAIHSIGNDRRGNYSEIKSHVGLIESRRDHTLWLDRWRYVLMELIEKSNNYFIICTKVLPLWIWIWIYIGSRS